jgi:hypothetical protein
VNVSATQETSWQRAIHHPVSLFGFVIMLSGTVIGNIAIAKIKNFVSDNEEPKEQEMFSTGQETETVNVGARRSAAIQKYRDLQPDGSYYKMIQLGWVLNGIGFLIMIFGIFI